MTRDRRRGMQEGLIIAMAVIVGQMVVTDWRRGRDSITKAMQP